MSLYHLEIESDPKQLITVEEFINYAARELNVDEEKLRGILISVTEATTNAIIHGNKNDKNKTVNIDVDKIGNELIIKIKDQGKGFNPEEIPDPTTPDNLLKDSGRGLYLMKYFCKQIKYNPQADGLETILTISLS